jgi:toxin ParE1/3/4
MRIGWSARAYEDRVAIFDYIEADSPSEQIEQLTRFPEIGRPGRAEGTRELIIHATPYIVAYKVASKTVTILRILHGAQQWPETPSE